MMITTVEVAPEPGGYKVSVIRTYDNGRDPEVEVLTHRRRRTRAKLVGQGAAMALHCEFKFHSQRTGRYTTEAASYGNDRRDRKG